VQQVTASVAGRAAVRRRGRTSPARRCELKLYLSVQERDLVRAAAAGVGMTAGGFAARAAVDAALAGVVPVGARSGWEQLAALQFELATVRRVLDLLRDELAGAGSGQGRPVSAEVWRRCEQAAQELTRLAGVVHQRLGGDR
jgi:NADPH:quinone reductase-like Zn-dependent oxidoreductase